MAAGEKIYTEEDLRKACARVRGFWIAALIGAVAGMLAPDLLRLFGLIR